MDNITLIYQQEGPENYDPYSFTVAEMDCIFINQFEWKSEQPYTFGL